MDRRRRVNRNLHSDEPINRYTLVTLGGLEQDVYIVSRTREAGNSDLDILAGNPDIFLKMFTADPITIFKVDRESCRRAAARMQDGSGVIQKEPTAVSPFQNNS